MLLHDAQRSRPLPAHTAPYLSCAASHGSLSSAETLTPESAVGRPSVASATSPQSEVSERLGGSCKASLQNSSTNSLQFRPQPPDTRSEFRAIAGEFRRNKYREPILHHCPALPQIQSEAVDLQARTPSASSTVSAERRRVLLPAAAAAGHEVLIEGPLQQRALLFLWRKRWCVLDHFELRIYDDEEAFLLQPESPLQLHSVDKLDFTWDVQLPLIMNCIDVDTGELLMCLRVGPGSQWEEVAAASLWMSACSQVSVQKRSASDYRFMA